MKTLPILLCVLALGACSDKPPQPQAKPAQVATPWDAMKADEQHARDVQKIVDKQAEEQRKQIEAQEQ
ncbi:hypothetical protein [Rhodanobacter sp. C01]|uniref:hypothetical protein n=1 Tax=Rhodanobacter sp. C01 TaxID=1945856 RepID=UPI0009855423|nr:hypothetical protein [Rhodanobacter sp. C01]OOG51329.1 hypothetical protein B0E50_01030 [Rhodanobacter sp. C01]